MMEQDWDPDLFSRVMLFISGMPDGSYVKRLLIVPYSVDGRNLERNEQTNTKIERKSILEEHLQIVTYQAYDSLLSFSKHPSRDYMYQTR